jgi:cell division protein FtsQ
VFGLPKFKRNRRQPQRDEPTLLERINWSAIAAALGVVVVLAGSSMLLVLALDRPVRHVNLEGSFQRVSPAEVEAALGTSVRGGLASLDRVLVQRRWPETVRVVVTEQIPAARWGEAGLLNTRGELFIRNAKYLPPELPLLEGPDGTEGRVARLYLESQGRLLEAGLRLTGVRLDERGAWELQLGEDLVVRLGRQNVEERLERFIALASSMVAKRQPEIRYVDMRYTNGFSVGWNPRPALAVATSEDATPDA